MLSTHPVIESLKNSSIKDLVKLRERRYRDRTDRFLIEGYRELSHAVGASWEIETLFYCPEHFLGVNEGALLADLEGKGVELIACTEAVFSKASYRDRPDGLLAVAKQRHLDITALNTLLNSTKNPLIVVAEAIEKPGNLGTILRSANAVAADAVIVCDRCTDIYNPNVVRASVGMLFTQPVFELKGEDVLTSLQSHGVQCLAATPEAKELFTEVPMQGAIAIVVGTEQYGLSPLWMDRSDLQVRIPMMGVADSLNVATATTLLLYEVLRQRQL